MLASLAFLRVISPIFSENQILFWVEIGLEVSVLISLFPTVAREIRVMVLVLRNEIRRRIIIDGLLGELQGKSPLHHSGHVF